MKTKHLLKAALPVLVSLLSYASSAQKIGIFDVDKVLSTHLPGRRIVSTLLLSATAT